jgi:hypothetical protein
VSIIVSVEHLAIPAKIFGTERTAMPLADDMLHMPVAESRRMCEAAKITCFRRDQQSPPSLVVLHTCRVTWYIRNRAGGGPRDLDT